MQSILDVREGDVVTDFFFIREREIKQASNGSDYATFLLERNLEHIQARLWDITNEQKSIFDRKVIVKIEATMERYRGKRQLHINRIRLATEDDKVNVTELLARKGVQREDLWQDLRLLMEEIESETIRAIIKQVFGQRSFRDRFTTIPASKMYHHAYYAGLLEHVVHTAKSAYQLLPLYPYINKDIVIATCLLHDVGKTQLFTEAIAPDHTTVGELVGHLSLSLELIYDAAKEAGIARDNPELIRLKHCVASQFGEVSQGYGSAVSPKTAEAIFFYHLKQMNTLLHGFDILQEHARESWTYSPMFKRKLYTKKGKEEDHSE